MTGFGLAGTPQFAADIGETLIAAGNRPAFILTRKDKPAGRGQKITPSPMHSLALQHSIPCIFTEKIDDTCLNAVRNYPVELLVVIAFGLILPKKFLENITCVNLHTSLLPRWRGAAPIARTIETGDTTTGITLMKISQQLDAGDILAQKECRVDALETSASLTVKLQSLATQTLKEFLKAPDQFKGTAQDESRVVYAAKIDKSEAILNWTEPAEVLARKIRAFNPVPGCHTEYRGQLLKIWMAQAVADADSNSNYEKSDITAERSTNMPGTVIKQDSRGLWIACGQGYLVVSEIQFAGKRKTSVSVGANNSHLPKAGECLGASS